MTSPLELGGLIPGQAPTPSLTILLLPSLRMPAQPLLPQAIIS